MSEKNRAGWTQGIHHLGVTVPDIQATRNFFVERLGFSEVGGRPAYPSVFVSDGTVMLTIWQAQEPESARPFDRKNNIGLHHLALRVSEPERLDELHEHLAGCEEVEIEFGPEALGTAGARHMMCSIPGGLRLELIAPPA